MMIALEGVILGQGVKLGAFGMQLGPSFFSIHFLNRRKKFVIHRSDAVAREIFLGPVAAGQRGNRMGVVDRPDELLERAASKARQSVEIVLCESAPVGADHGRARHHGLDLRSAERLRKETGRDHGLGMCQKLAAFVVTSEPDETWSN